MSKPLSKRQERKLKMLSKLTPEQLAEWRKKENSFSYASRKRKRTADLESRINKAKTNNSASGHLLAYMEGRSAEQMRKKNLENPPTEKELQIRLTERRRRDFLVKSGKYLEWLRRTITILPLNNCIHITNTFPILLQQFDHEDRKTKNFNLSNINVKNRDEERSKCSIKCLVCHQTKTNIEMKAGVCTKSRGITVKMIKNLKTICEHPVHEKMMYANIVDSYLNDEKNIIVFKQSILHHSHLVPNGNAVKRSKNALLEDIKNGLTRVVCCFCHAVETMLEMRAYETYRWSERKGLERSPILDFHYNQFLSFGEAFTEFEIDFNNKTKGFDWLSWKIPKTSFTDELENGNEWKKQKVVN